MRRHPINEEAAELRRRFVEDVRTGDRVNGIYGVYVVERESTQKAFANWTYQQIACWAPENGLRQLSGAVAKAPYYHLIYCCVPDEWVEGEIPQSDDLWLKGPVLSAEKQESLLDALYGAGWRGGNSDGSQYIVIGSGTRLLNPQIESARPWLSDNMSDSSIRFLHYAGAAEGHFQRVLPSGL